jgi:hypothetical protein
MGRAGLCVRMELAFMVFSLFIGIMRWRVRLPYEKSGNTGG